MSWFVSNVFRALFFGIIFCVVSACPSSWKKQKVAMPQATVKSMNFSVRLPGVQRANLGGELFVPASGIELVEPRTVVVFVPGSGFVSRRGTQHGDGTLHYDEPVHVNTEWAHALASKGFYSYLYDKRSCSKLHDPLCHDNPTHDIRQAGPVALAKDVDAACNAVWQRFGDKSRIVLWTTDQGTQVVLSSQCQKKASLLVFLAPIPYRLDEFWSEGLMLASEKPLNSSQKNNLEHRAKSIQATFESIENGLFAPKAKVMGAPLQFWKEWVSLTKNSEQLFADSKTPMLMVLGEEDGYYGERAIEALSAYSLTNENRRLFQVWGVDRNLLSNRTLDNLTVDILSGALARALNHD